MMQLGSEERHDGAEERSLSEPTAAELAEMLRELVSVGTDMPSYADTIERACTMVDQAIACGIIADDT